MTTALKKQQAIFPDMPKNPQMVDPNSGVLLPEWALFLSQLSQALQGNYQREGVKTPAQTTTDINNIISRANDTNTGRQLGNVIYDSVTKTFKGIVEDSTTPDGKPIVKIVEFTTT